MIDEDRIDALVALAWPLAGPGRVAMLDGFTRLPLTPRAWRQAASLAHALIAHADAADDDPTVDVLARVPLRSVREGLRARARGDAGAVGRRIALALAGQRDVSAVPRLVRDFRQRPDAELARALACVLQPGQGVVAEELRAGLGSDDEMVRLWTAIAIARVDRGDGAGPDLEPLEQLWDALARPALAGAARRPLFDGPPGIFHGDPSWAAAQIAAVRPLPAVAHRFVLGLKEHDFDGWEPRRPGAVQDSAALRALFSGLTGPEGAWTGPAAPPAGPGLAPPADPELATRIRRLLGRRTRKPGWAVGNELLDLARGVSPQAPLEIAPLLENDAFLRVVPREQLAWVLARNGDERVVDELTAQLRRLPAPRRLDAVEWLRDIAAGIDAPPPYQGSGGAPAPPAGPVELIDDGGGAIAGATPPVERPGAEPLPPMPPMPPAPTAAPSPREPRRPGLATPAPSTPVAPGSGGRRRSIRVRTPGDSGGGASAPVASGAEPSPAAAAVATGAAAAGPPADEPCFHFRLAGAQALGDAVCSGSRSQLEFRFDRPPPDALATVDSDELEQVRRADRDLMLEATAYGSLSLPGSRHGVARFRQGALQAPVVFELQAGVADDSGSGVHVEFIVAGETVHQVDLPIAVLADADALRRRAQQRPGRGGIGLGLLDDAAGAAPPPPQRLRMALSLDAQGFRIDLTHWIGDKPTNLGPFIEPDIDRARLENLVASLRKDLEACYRHPMWTQFDGRLDDGETGRMARAELPRTCSAVAAVGARLNQSLRQDAPALAQALDHVEARLPEGATLTVATDTVYLPWEILYPRPWLADFTDEQRRAFPLDPQLFWGARFAIETVQLRNSGSLVEQRRRHLAAPPRVSVNLNPRITVDGLAAADQPLDVQRAWADALSGSGRLEAVQDECQAMRRVLQDADTQASLVYVYCHGSAARPFGGGDELLELAKGCTITPLHLAGDRPFDAAPIVFLNACESASHSPLAFSSFLKEFRRRGALGMIAASFAVPIVFGAHFGAEVAQCVLERRGPLADSLRRLRRRHLLESGLDLGNPIPLFYALQCQITYPDGDTR